YFARARVHLPVFPGAAALVARRARLGPVGIVSGALRDEIELGLQTLAVAEHVGFIVSAEDTSACKPDPEGYLRGLSELTNRIGEDAARRALVIEDSLAGVEAARAAGLTCVAVAHSYPKARLEAAGADCVVERLDELSDSLLESLYQRVHG
ncbi:MAG TPA: HAD family phosphatase, partial [Polyangiaceae bacterium]|nr:HAD family phosphatase [Polyangiaceae bacterium]